MGLPTNLYDQVCKAEKNNFIKKYRRFIIHVKTNHEMIYYIDLGSRLLMENVSFQSSNA